MYSQMMRPLKTTLFALATLLVALGMSTSAQAVPPAVDQYTEQPPDPAGPPPVPTPTPKPKPTPSKPSDGNAGSSSSAPTDPSVAPVGSSQVDGTDEETGKKGKRKSDRDRDDEAAAGAAGGSDGGSGSTSALKVAHPRVDSGAGMGWLFPISLAVIAAAVGTAVFQKRRHGSVRAT